MKYSFHNNRKIDKVLSRLRLTVLIKAKNSIKTILNMRANTTKDIRFLEIGPGLESLTGFETLNIIDGHNVDYIMDIIKPLSFKDNSFDLIYASHVMEHVPWYLQENVFKELYRILKPNGILEVWVPDGLKIIKTLYEYEEKGIDNTVQDGWYRFNSDKKVEIWANGRIFTYGDGTDNAAHPNWHKTLFTPNLLKFYCDKVGFTTSFMDISEVRGYNHGWINLGVKATKKK